MIFSLLISLFFFTLTIISTISLFKKDDKFEVPLDLTTGYFTYGVGYFLTFLLMFLDIKSYPIATLIIFSYFAGNISFLRAIILTKIITTKNIITVKKIRFYHISFYLTTLITSFLAVYMFSKYKTDYITLPIIFDNKALNILHFSVNLIYWSYSTILIPNKKYYYFAKIGSGFYNLSMIIMIFLVLLVPFDMIKDFLFIPKIFVLIGITCIIINNLDMYKTKMIKDLEK